VHIKACSVIGVKELPESSRIRQLVLKADSEATVEMGIVDMSCANFERARKQTELHFHQVRNFKIRRRFLCILR
jgi:hypothetical protein